MYQQTISRQSLGFTDTDLHKIDEVISVTMTSYHYSDDESRQTQDDPGKPKPKSNRLVSQLSESVHGAALMIL